MQELNQLLTSASAQSAQSAGRTGWSSSRTGSSSGSTSGNSSSGFNALLQTKYATWNSSTGTAQKATDTKQTNSSSESRQTEQTDSSGTEKTQSASDRTSDRTSDKAAEGTGGKDGVQKDAAEVQAEAAEEEVTGEQLAMAAGLMGAVQVDVVAEDVVVVVDAAAEMVTGQELLTADGTGTTDVTPVMDAAVEVVTADDGGAAVEVVSGDVQETAAESSAVQTTVSETQVADTGEETVVVSEQPVAEAAASQEGQSTGNRTDGQVQVTGSSGADEEQEVSGQEAAAQPVFELKDSIPVKVAEPVAETPIPLETTEGSAELDNVVLDLLQSGGEKVVLTLSPASLGTISVELTRGTDGTLSVLLTATTSRAASLLDQHVNTLQQVLAAAEQKDVHVEVQRNEETPQQFLNPDGQSRQEQEQRRQQQARQDDSQDDFDSVLHGQDFLQRLRLGLIEAV